MRAVPYAPDGSTTRNGSWATSHFSSIRPPARLGSSVIAPPPSMLFGFRMMGRTSRSEDSSFSENPT